MSMFHIFVDKIPSCKQCPFYIRDDNKENQGKEVYRCAIKYQISTAQFGGMDLAEKNNNKCIWKLLPCLETNGKCPECGCSCINC